MVQVIAALELSAPNAANTVAVATTAASALHARPGWRRSIALPSGLRRRAVTRVDANWTPAHDYPEAASTNVQSGAGSGSDAHPDGPRPADPRDDRAEAKATCAAGHPRPGDEAAGAADPDAGHEAAVAVGPDV